MAAPCRDLRRELGSPDSSSGGAIGRDRRSLLTVVVPAHNEAAHVAAVVRETLQYAAEVIVVDDASTDTTAEVARAAGAQVVRNAKRVGYIGAVKRGFEEARAEFVATLDADGECPADALPRLQEVLLRGDADMVQGSRAKGVRLSERFLTWLAGRAAPVGDSGTGLRVLRTDLARRLEVRGTCICGVLSLEVLGRGGRIVDEPVIMREAGKPRRIAWFHIRQMFHVLRAVASFRRARVV